MSRSERREARRASDQAEYEASLERAKQATDEQRTHPGSNAAAMGFSFGLIGLAVGSALDRRRRKQTPPRPDR